MPPVGVVADNPSRVLATLVAQVNALVADVTAIRTTLNAHVHSGITAGAANSGAPTTTAAALTAVGVTVNK